MFEYVKPTLFTVKFREANLHLNCYYLSEFGPQAKKCRLSKIINSLYEFFRVLIEVKIQISKKIIKCNNEITAQNMQISFKKPRLH